MVTKNAFGRATNFRDVSNSIVMRSLAIALIFVVLGTFILSYRVQNTNLADLVLGSVTPENITAPSQVVYTSQIKTEEARERARNAIPPIYTPPDPQVARTQVQQLRDIFDYLETVRADPYASLPQKAEWVRAINGLTLSDLVIDQILIINDQAWQETVSEALRVLDEALKAEIRENQMISARRRLPNQVARDTPENQSQIIVALTEDLIKPNTLLDEEARAKEQQTAASNVEDVIEQVEKDELILAEGQIVHPLDLEKLEALGLQQPAFNWLKDFVAPAFLILLMTVIVAVYLIQYTPHIVFDTKRLCLLATLVLAFLAIAKFLIAHPDVNMTFYPIAALTMMMVILINIQLAFVIAAIMAFLAAYLVVDDAPLVVTYLILSGWTGALALNKGRQVSALLWAGLHVGLVNVAVILIFTLQSDTLEVNSTIVGSILLEGLLNGIFSAGLALIGLISVSRLMGITTTMQLIDLARPTHPLLRQLLLKAPGTYHHSLMVSNLSEQAAERIGADAMLVRVMAYYHDIGKMQRPYFFVENQPQGVNVHEKLDPQVSAQIIISHVTDGLELAKKYRLPSIIQDGISQHHGTSLVKFFYYQAVKDANETGQKINETDFHYPGPRPQNKENGILMLADVTESVVRAFKPGSTEEIDEIVQKIIAEKLETGQLNQCDLTIADLYKVREAFVDMLQGVHHPRIKYPDPVKPNDQSSASNKETPSAPAKTPTPSEPTDSKVAQPTNDNHPAPTSLTPASQPSKLIRRE